MDTTTPEFLTLPDRRLAYQLRRGRPDVPGIVFLGGYASDMSGAKAQFLAERCAGANLSYLRFDYQGHGQSSGNFMDGTIGMWFEDASLVFDRLTTGPQIIIGSSMGGWMALLLALKNPLRARALIGIAAGPDFTEDIVLSELTIEQRQQLDRDGVAYFGGHTPDAPLPFTKRLIEEARKHIVLQSSINIPCPVRLLQGMQDQDIPWQHAMRIVRSVEHGDVRVTLIKDGGHRLSRPEDLEALWHMIGEFV